MGVLPFFEEVADQVVKWRHEFHQHPELPLHEEWTSHRIAELLRGFCLDEVVEDLGHIGVIGVLRQGEGPSIGLFAGIDAQPFSEQNESLSHKSENSEAMHAFGNDGEIAMLLSTAEYLANTRYFKGTVVFIFASSFGTGFGVRTMIEDGLLDRFPIDELYCLNTHPGMPVGDVALASGPCMSAVAELLIKIIGKAGHAAYPRQCKNPILAAAAIINLLEALPVNIVDPSDPLLVRVTSVLSGDSFFEVPAEAELKATVRFLNPSLEEWLPDRIDLLARNIAESFDVQSVISYRLVCPPVVNALEPLRFARRVARALFGEEHVQEEQPTPLLGSDVSYLMHERPGACITLGSGEGPELMSYNYDFNDAVLPVGSTLLAGLVEAFLKAK